MANKNLSLKQKLLAGVAVTALATGGTVAAVGATGGGGKHPRRAAHAPHAARSHPGCFAGQFRIAAAYLGVSPSQLSKEVASGKSQAQVANATAGKSAGGLVEAIVDARKAGLVQRLASGKLSRAKETARLAKLARRVTARINLAGDCAGFRGAHSLPSLAPAAGYLGTPVRELRAKLRSGQSLAQVAGATSGKSAAGLIAALVADRRARLAREAAAGTITHARENALAATLTSSVTEMVERVPPPSPGKKAATSHLNPVASYLGLSREQLKAALHSRRTLGQIADATPGKSAAGLIAALVQERRAKLEAAVAAGRLSATREKALLAQLPQRIAAVVNGASR